jgi:predicted YcjX-like family ATPase
MSIFRVKTTEARVGVVGLYNSGKTVLLTSLINHLKDYEASRFALGNEKDPAVLRKFRVHPAESGWAPFAYDAYRDALVNRGRWPEKTRDRAQYVCQFERSDWTFSDCLLKLYDLPGERIADAAMLGRNFAAWSEHVLNLFRSDRVYRDCTAPFLNALESPLENSDKLLRAYRLALGHLIWHYKPFISPSTFLLDVHGKLAKRLQPEELADSRDSGVSADQQFCPLPAQFRTPGSEVLAAFTTRYQNYIDQVVTPSIQALRSCTSLIVMIDVTMLLAGGVGMYDDNRQIVKDLLDVLNPGEHPVFGPIGRAFGKVFLPHEWRPGWITRVAFVAPKMDLVHPADRDRMLRLMRQMVERFAADHDGLNARFFNCSAMVATKVRPSETGERLMVGIPFRDPTGSRLPPGAEQRFGVSELPEDWPQEWKPGQYVFPEVYPKMPARKDHPPEQVNLDRVASFVID